MKIHHSFRTPDQASIRFRVKHPNESFAGLPGVYALTVNPGVDMQPLHFQAANDLACLDGDRLEAHPMFEHCQEFGNVGVAVCVLPRTTQEFRESLARRLNAGAGLTEMAA